MGVHIKRSTRQDCGPALGQFDEDDSIQRHHPALWEFLSLSSWEDGSPRQTGTVLLVVDAGMVKAWLNDRDGQRAAWASGDSLGGVLERLEVGLTKDTLEWRASQPKSRKR